MFHPAQNWMFQPDDVPLNTSRVQKLQVHQNLVVFFCLYNKQKNIFCLFVWIWLEYRYKIQEKCRLMCLVLNVRVVLVKSWYLKHSETSSVLLVPAILSAISYKTAARWNCADKRWRQRQGKGLEAVIEIGPAWRMITWLCARVWEKVCCKGFESNIKCWHLHSVKKGAPPAGSA